MRVLTKNFLKVTNPVQRNKLPYCPSGQISQRLRISGHPTKAVTTQSLWLFLSPSVNLFLHFFHLHVAWPCVTMPIWPTVITSTGNCEPRSTYATASWTSARMTAVTLRSLSSRSSSNTRPWKTPSILTTSPLSSEFTPSTTLPSNGALSSATATLPRWGTATAILSVTIILRATMGATACAWGPATTGSGGMESATPSATAFTMITMMVIAVTPRSQMSQKPALILSLLRGELVLQYGSTLATNSNPGIILVGCAREFMFWS